MRKAKMALLTAAAACCIMVQSDALAIGDTGIDGTTGKTEMGTGGFTDYNLRGAGNSYLDRSGGNENDHYRGFGAADTGSNYDWIGWFGLLGLAGIIGRPNTRNIS